MFFPQSRRPSLCNHKKQQANLIMWNIYPNFIIHYSSSLANLIIQVLLRTGMTCQQCSNPPSCSSPSPWLRTHLTCQSFWPPLIMSFKITRTLAKFSSKLHLFQHIQPVFNMLTPHNSSFFVLKSISGAWFQKCRCLLRSGITTTDKKKKRLVIQFVISEFLGFPQATTTLIPVMKVLLCASIP